MYVNLDKDCDTIYENRLHNKYLEGENTAGTENPDKQ